MAQPHYVSDSMATFPSTGYLLAEPYGVILVFIEIYNVDYWYLEFSINVDFSTFGWCYFKWKYMYC